jgi:hypothetical protein
MRKVVYKVKIWDSDSTAGYMDYYREGKPELSFWGKFRLSAKLFFML